MEHLTKQQIVLLTLLVSFVTSLSTGIVTVSLMDQAPAGVTHTVNQIIEKTIQQAAPQNASVGIISLNVDDQIASATATVSSSTVKIMNAVNKNIVGLGLIITKDGFVITDKSIIDPSQSYVIVLNDGITVPVSISTLYANTIQINSQTTNQINNSSILLTPSSNYVNGSPILFKPAQLVSTYSLGQKIFSLTGTSSFVFHDGLIRQLSSSTIDTSIPSGGSIVGSPLFDIQGNIIGIQGTSTNSQDNSIFNLIAPFSLPSPVL